MATQPANAIPPEYKLADLFISRMPRSRQINEKELKEIIDWSDPAERALYNKYSTITIDLLLKQGLIQKYTSAGMGTLNQGSSYSLTENGREVKDETGYLRYYKEKREKELLSKKAINADHKGKIWNLQTSHIVLGLSVLGSLVLVLTLWERFSVDSGRLRPSSTTSSSPDSSNKSGSDGQAGPMGSSPKKGQDLSASAPSSTALKGYRLKPVIAGHTTVNKSRSDNPAFPMSSSLPPRPVNSPLQTAWYDNITFSLLKAVGSSKAQSVTLILTLTTSAANTKINENVNSVIDGDGNEYKLKSFTNGTSGFTMIDLTTGIPIKCTYTFDGVLPEVKSFKLFKYVYYHFGTLLTVEFRDIPIEWK